MGLRDVKGYDPALIEDPVHCGDVYITFKIFNSGADIPQATAPNQKQCQVKTASSRGLPPQDIWLITRLTHTRKHFIS